MENMLTKMGLPLKMAETYRVISRERMGEINVYHGVRELLAKANVDGEPGKSTITISEIFKNIGNRHTRAIRDGIMSIGAFNAKAHATRPGLGAPHLCRVRSLGPKQLQAKWIQWQSSEKTIEAAGIRRARQPGLAPVISLGPTPQ